MLRSYQDESRRNWGVETEPSNDQLQLGCLQRIANAQEQMAKPFVALLEDVASVRRSYKERGEIIDRLDRSNAALRGVITKMKKARL